MRRPVVAGNWKMHGLRSSNKALLADLERGLNAEWPIDVVVFPPYVYLDEAARLLEGGQIGLGAQDVCAEGGGAFTGQVSATMLKDVGCRYVIVGHSERRRLYHEDDSLVARKFGAVLQAGMTPLLCVGETLDEHEAHHTEMVVARQLGAVMAMHGAASFAQAIVAYEPVWAIGTGRTATRSRRRRCMPTCAAGLARKMLRWRAICGFCTAAASRAETPKSFSQWPTWMVVWWAAPR